MNTIETFATIVAAALPITSESQAKEIFRDTFARLATEHGTISPMTADEANEYFHTWSDCADACYCDIEAESIYFKLPAGTPVPEAITYTFIPGVKGKSDIYIFTK